MLTTYLRTFTHSNVSVDTIQLLIINSYSFYLVKAYCGKRTVVNMVGDSEESTTVFVIKDFKIWTDSVINNIRKVLRGLEMCPRRGLLLGHQRKGSSLLI